MRRFELRAGRFLLVRVSIETVDPNVRKLFLPFVGLSRFFYR
ncbi:hypothetical protein LG3211_2162 [Lysobacter gummosus]|nr:hypothetical protein LG3211_2162 [Lysobacter gummosus]